MIKPVHESKPFATEAAADTHFTWMGPKGAVQVPHSLLWTALACSGLLWTALAWTLPGLFLACSGPLSGQPALPARRAEGRSLLSGSTTYLTLLAGRNRFDSIRFGSGLFENSSVWFGSVRKNICPGSTRFSLRFLDALWLGPVRFSSVRPVRFGFLFLPVLV